MIFFLFVFFLPFLVCQRHPLCSNQPTTPSLYSRQFRSFSRLPETCDLPGLAIRRGSLPGRRLISRRPSFLPPPLSSLKLEATVENVQVVFSLLSCSIFFSLVVRSAVADRWSRLHTLLYSALRFMISRDPPIIFLSSPSLLYLNFHLDCTGVDIWSIPRHTRSARSALRQL